MATCECGRDVRDAGVLCWPCARDLAGQLRDVPHVLAQLRVTASRLSRMGAASGRTSPGSLPVHVGAMDAAAGLRAAVRGWAARLGPAPPGVAPWERLAGNVAAVRMAEWAAECAADVHTRVRAGWALVDRPASLTVACRCGTRVPLDPDEIVRCGRCGEWGTVGWWVEHYAPAGEGPLPLTGLPGWLLVHHGLRVTVRQVRVWADAGRITPVETGVLGQGGGRGVRLFDPVAVAAVAQTAHTRS